MLKFLIFAYITLVAVWGAAWIAIGDANWFFYCLNRFAPFLYIPGVIVPLFTLVISRHAPLTFLSLLPLIFFFTIFWPHIAPRSSSDSDGDLSAMTYNILCSNTNIKGIATVIRQNDPDLIAFQEMTESQFAHLSNLLGDKYPYRKISPQVPCGTTAVFSQIPITHHRVLDLQSDRPALITHVETEDRSLIFVSAHLLPMYRARIQPLLKRPAAIDEFIADKAKQVEILIDTLKAFDSDLVILACDCNTLLTHATYKTLSKEFVDMATVAGLPRSINGAMRNNNPYQLDYIFARGLLRTTANYRLSDSAGSDHQPVIAKFTLL